MVYKSVEHGKLPLICFFTITQKKYSRIVFIFRCESLCVTSDVIFIVSTPIDTQSGFGWLTGCVAVASILTLIIFIIIVFIRQCIFSVERGKFLTKIMEYLLFNSNPESERQGPVVRSLIKLILDEREL